MRSETSVLLTTSENDFTYRNYAKKDFVLDGNGNVTGWSYPLERNRNCSYRDFHILQELYYDAGRGGDFGLSAWYMDSSRGLPLLGDIRYGSKDANCSTALWSYRLALIHPITGERIDVTQPPPEQYPWNLFNCDELRG